MEIHSGSPALLVIEEEVYIDFGKLVNNEFTVEQLGGNHLGKVHNYSEIIFKVFVDLLRYTYR